MRVLEQKVTKEYPPTKMKGQYLWKGGGKRARRGRDRIVSACCWGQKTRGRELRQI